jgi:Tol biopolymer transport system component
MPLSPGARLGPYEVLSPLGAGGMGEVYRARDPRLGRDVAIKVLPEGATAEPERLRRFELEARAAGALSHPNLLAVFDTGRHEGAPFVVFELLQGETLRARLGGGALPPPKALDYAIQMARGLSAAHEKGIVHRDLKPENLFLTRDGPLKILDFGLAKLRPPLDPGDVSSETRTASVHTEAHTILGTVGYMSPEQVRRSPADHRSDIFSFGLVLYEMLSGSRPFRGGTEAETMTAILNQDPPPLTGATDKVPVALERVLRHCLEKRPEDRFQSTRDLVFNLEAIALAGTGARGWSSWRSRRLRLAMVAGAAVLGLLAVGGVVRNWFAHGLWNARRTARLSAVPLTSLPGWERYPALSPDGSHLAFSWNDRGPLGNRDIYVQLIGAGTPLRLTTDPADDRSPAWSPDGRHIAFLRCLGREPGVFTVPAMGGPERRLQAASCSLLADEEGRSLDWSDDGKLLAFPDKTSADGFSIFLLSIETLEKRRLTFPPAEHQADERPAFSPDGRSVAFARVGGTTEPSLFVVPVAGGEPRRLSLGDAWTGGVPGGYTWTPDGSSIVFSGAGTWVTISGSLWKVPANGGVPEPLGVGGDNASQPSISRRGNRLAFVQTHIDTDTWEMGMSGSPPRGHSPRKVISSSRRDDGPQLSPDGSKIAFESVRSGSGEIWICDRDGTNALQLTRFGAGTPRWSPDGRRITFDSSKEGHYDIFVLDVAGGLPRRLTSEASWDAVPSWSGDGRWIYFGSNRTGAFQVWKAPAEGGPAIQVTRSGGYAAFESPDGSRLYYAKYDAPGIWTVPVKGGEEKPVHDLPPTGYWGSWGIGRRGLYFVNPEAKPRPTIDLLDLATRRVTRIADMERQPMQWASGFSVARDERSILYSQLEQSNSDVMLVEGFR